MNKNKSAYIKGGGCQTLMNGEGGIRTHEGVTPTRFRVVRDQPDSATSPHALRRARSLKGRRTGHLLHASEANGAEVRKA